MVLQETDAMGRPTTGTAVVIPAKSPETTMLSIMLSMDIITLAMMKKLKGTTESLNA